MYVANASLNGPVMYRANVNAIQAIVMIPVISTGTAVTAVPINDENACVTRAIPTSPA